MASASVASDPLARRLGVFDSTMIVMGGIIGSGIFVNPYVVAREVHTSALILGAWILGGLVALAGAFVYAELAVLRPNLGGQYTYLQEAFHPGVAFLYGWALLLVMQTGGMAAVAVTFARYSHQLIPYTWPEGLVATLTLLVLSAINCVGVRFGSTVQNVLMVLKIAAIGGLILAGFRAPNAAPQPTQEPALSFSLLVVFGAAVVPVLFAYGGWQTASFMTGEMRNPKRDLARAVLLGVTGVTVIYIAVNIVCLRSLGPLGLAQTTTPAYTVMQRSIGAGGATFMALAISLRR